MKMLKRAAWPPAKGTATLASASRAKAGSILKVRQADWVTWRKRFPLRRVETVRHEKTWFGCAGSAFYCNHIPADTGVPHVRHPESWVGQIRDC